MSIQNITVPNAYNLYADSITVNEMNVEPTQVEFNFEGALDGISYDGVFLSKYGNVVFMTFDQSPQLDIQNINQKITLPAGTIPEDFLPPIEVGDSTWVNIVLNVNTQPVLCPMEILDNGSATIFNGYTDPIANATFGAGWVKFTQNGVCWGTKNN